MSYINPCQHGGSSSCLIELPPVMSTSVYIEFLSDAKENSWATDSKNDRV